MSGQLLPVSSSQVTEHLQKSLNAYDVNILQFSLTYVMQLPSKQYLNNSVIFPLHVNEHNFRLNDVTDFKLHTYVKVHQCFKLTKFGGNPLFTLGLRNHCISLIHRRGRYEACMTSSFIFSESPRPTLSFMCPNPSVIELFWVKLQLPVTPEVKVICTQHWIH